MAKLANLARMTTATVGTGTLTLGSAVADRLTFAQAGIVNGDVVTYTILDLGNGNVEVGRGTYTSSGTTLSRDTVLNSTNGGSKISISASGAEVAITAAAEDLGWVELGKASPSGTGTVTFNNLSGNFSALKIVGVGRSDAAGTGTAVVQLRFNNDSGANYSIQGQAGNVTTSTVFQSVSQTSAQVAELSKAGDLADYGSCFEIVVPFYAGTTFKKSFLSRYQVLNNTGLTSLFDICISAVWNSLSAITRVDLILSTGNWVSGSQVKIYGIP